MKKILVAMLFMLGVVQQANAAALLGTNLGPFLTEVNESITIPILDLEQNPNTPMAVQGCSGTDPGADLSMMTEAVQYFPGLDFEGIDTFQCEVEDGSGAITVVNITVHVGNVPVEDNPEQPTTEGQIEEQVVGAANKSTARMLDTVCGGEGTASGELARACNELAETDRNLNEIMSEITPDEALAMPRVMSSISQAQTGRISQHQTALRTGINRNMSFTGNEFWLQSYRGGTAGDGAASPWGLFGSVHTDNGKHDRTGNESSYKTTGMGATVGVDYRFSPSLFAGAALDWSTYKIKHAKNSGTIETDVTSLSGFLTWYQQQFSVDLQLGYGRGDFDTRRNVTFPYVAAINGSTNSDQYNLGLQGDWTWNQGALTLRPFVRLDYVSTRIDGYREASASPWAMQVGSQSIDQLTANLGVDASYALSFDWGVFVPGVKLSMASETQSDYSPISFRLLGVSGDDGLFKLQPDTEDDLFFQYELGGVFLFKGGWSAFLTAGGIGGYDNYSHYSVSAGARMEF